MVADKLFEKGLGHSAFQEANMAARSSSDSRSSSCCGQPYESCDAGLVCVECGLIIEITKFTVSESGIAMTSAGTVRVAVGKMDHRTVNRGISKAVKEMQSCLFSQMKGLRLSTTISSQIRNFLFNSVYPAKKSWKMSTKRNVVTACCIYIVCRQNGMALSLGNMAQVADCCMFTLGRNVKIVCEKLGIKLDTLEADAYIPSVLGQFGIEGKSLETLVFDLLELCKHLLLNKGKHPVLVAVSLVVVAVESQGKPPSKAAVTKVSGDNNINETGVKKAVTSLKDHLLEMAKEVPWLARLGESASNPVNRMSIAKFIPDIIKFNQQCAKPDYTVIKPTWLKEKEKIGIERSKKITNAKLRIASKKEQLGDKEGILHGNVSFNGISASTPCKNSSTSKKEQTVSDFPEGGSLDSDDKLIEYLLQKGFVESQLHDNTLESLYYSCQSPSYASAVDMEREDLDEGDISKDDLYKYLRTPEEVKKLKRIHMENEPVDTSKKLKGLQS